MKVIIIPDRRIQDRKAGSGNQLKALAIICQRFRFNEFTDKITRL